MNAIVRLKWNCQKDYFTVMSLNPKTVTMLLDAYKETLEIERVRDSSDRATSYRNAVNFINRNFDDTFC